MKKIRIVPSITNRDDLSLKLYFKGNRAKILLGLAKGRKNYDKREVIKERDIMREVQKQFKNY